jgi:hypothetical protein
LEDLEPHRFEDLIRQLIYDFRSWRALEATGRGGSDDGFDVRGVEIVPSLRDSREPISEEHEDDDGEEGADVDLTFGGTEDRIWLIQCKRERSIPPKKLVRYLDDISESERTGLYGIIFAAACDFSKAARDAFREKVVELGFSEAHLWGKGEIEDRLFQPKNDQLLFAYFGFSLLTRQRSLKTAVRSRLAMKRKALRCIRDYQTVLVRDATDDRYPYLDEDESLGRAERGRWNVWTCTGCFHNGLRFVFARHFAYLGDDGEEWDYAECMNDARIRKFENPWLEGDDAARADSRSAAMEIWNALPEKNRAWYELLGVLPFESIIDIDDKADEFTENTPHIYVSAFHARLGPFDRILFTLETVTPEHRSGEAIEKKRVTKFARRTAPN